MSRTRHAQKESNKRGGKRYSTHCKNNGSCPYCLSNRTHKYKRHAAMNEKAIELELKHEDNDWRVE